MSVWNSTSVATTEQIAEYYEVPKQTIQNIVDRRSEEFVNEVKVLKGKDLQDVTLSLSVSQRTPKVSVFTARGALRVGLLLTQSEVAKNVRDVVLNVVESLPEIVLKERCILEYGKSYKNKEFNNQYLLNPARPSVEDKNYIIQQFLNEAWNEKRNQVRIIFETIYEVGIENKNFNS